jgi:hypothetical protein
MQRKKVEAPPCVHRKLPHASLTNTFKPFSANKMVAVGAAIQPIDIMPIENPFVKDDNGHAHADHFEQTFRIRIIDLEKPDEDDHVQIDGFYDRQQDAIVIELKLHDGLHFGSTGLHGQLGSLLLEWTAGRDARFVEAVWGGDDEMVPPPLPPLNDVDAFMGMRFQQMRHNVFALELEVQLIPRHNNNNNNNNNNNIIENPMDEEEAAANVVN